VWGCSMTDGNIWIGLDLGLRRTHLCVVDENGSPLHESCCGTSAEDLEALLAPYPLAQIGLIAVEAGSDMHVVRKLRNRGYPVEIFESRKASLFLRIRKSKTDKSDAKGLADLARLGSNTVSKVYLKSLACQQLRSRLVVRQGQIRLRRVAEGIIRSAVRLHGRDVAFPRSPASLRQACYTEFDVIKAEEGIDLAADLGPMVDICDALRSQLKRIDAELERLATSHETCRLLMEVPGVGFISALSFYTAIEDPSRFKRTSDVAAYLGLVPKRYQSGELSKVRGITKNGNKLTRTHLVTAAKSLRTRAPDTALGEWSIKLKERIGPRRSVVALARKLSIVLLTMWKAGSHYEAYPGRPSREADDAPVTGESLPLAQT
jgi:transposase